MSVKINGTDFNDMRDSILRKDNTEDYSPTEQFHPVTKKYVDDMVFGEVSGQRYVHTQVSPLSVWLVQHDLNSFPSVTIVDSGGSVVMGDIKYNSSNEIEITFSAEFSGKAYVS